MSTSKQPSPLLTDQLDLPTIHLSYEWILRERGQNTDASLYEIACSIAYPVVSSHLSIRVTGQHTYRNSAAREIPFTAHEAGATAYIELLEGEQLEVRVIAYQGAYGKALYLARKQALLEEYIRHMISTVQRLSV